MRWRWVQWLRWWSSADTKLSETHDPELPDDDSNSELPIYDPDDDDWHGYVNAALGLYCETCDAVIMDAGEYESPTLSFETWCAIIVHKAKSDGWSHQPVDKHYCPECTRTRNNRAAHRV